MPTMPTYRLDIEYDGTDWHGWQTQPDHPTIQAALEQAVLTVMREPLSIVGSGRTDAGVHALGQVAHMKTKRAIDPDRLCGSLNGILPKTVAVRSIVLVQDTFHARYDAVLRTYHYRVCCRPVAIGRMYRWQIRPTPDFQRMNEAAAHLVGSHNFSSFCRTSSETKNRNCVVQGAEWAADGRKGDWTFIISADRFLHGMVRSIVGTLTEVGHGKRAPEDVRMILAAEDRTAAGLAAPARGLVLHTVTYPEQLD